MKEELQLRRKMHWKYKTIIVIFTSINLVLMIVRYHSTQDIIKYLLLSEVLLIAAVIDLRTRLIPNYIHVLILMIGLIGFDPIDSLTGLLLAPLPFLIMAMIDKGSIGGGDIKLVGACGFALGIRMSIPIVILADLFIILYVLTTIALHKGTWKVRLPFVPFIYLAYCPLICVMQ